MTLKSGITWGVAAIVLLIILGYAYSRTESFIRGPQITIVSPENGQVTSDSFFFIEGAVKRASYITVNGRQVYTNETGELREEMSVAEGLNIFEIVATDRFGRVTKKVLTIVYK